MQLRWTMDRRLTDQRRQMKACARAGHAPEIAEAAHVHLEACTAKTL